jgi:hypothetical protein
MAAISAECEQLLLTTAQSVNHKNFVHQTVKLSIFSFSLLMGIYVLYRLFKNTRVRIAYVIMALLLI